jgi:hypothetical protein
MQATEASMSDHDTVWHPSHDEVEHILEELRPLLTQLARRDSFTLNAEAWRRQGLSEI